MNNYDITRGYDAILLGNEDENYIGQGDLQRILLEGRKVRLLSEMQSYNYLLENKGLQKLKPLKDSKYNEYILTIGDWKNADRLKAAKQTIADKAFNGTVGFAVNTLATFVDNTLGTAAGIVNAGVEGVGSIGTNESLGSALVRGFVTNPITSTMQGLRDWSREVAPIYRTEQLGNRSVGDMLTDPNFWFDDMLVNAGFTVGSMLSMYNGAYGTFKNPKGLFSTANYVALNPLLSSHALFNKIANKTTFGKELSRIELSKKYTRLGKINELVNSVEKEMMGKGPVNITPYINYNTTRGKLWNAWKASSGEARMEAYNAYSDFITDQSNALEERYNNDRNKILLSNDSDGQKQIKLEELELKYNNAKGSLLNKASQLAGFVFALNKVILTLSNAVDLLFFLRPIIKSKPNLIIRSSESLNRLKGAEVKEAINTAVKEGNLNAKTLLKNIKEKEAQEELLAAVKELGGEKAFNELLEKAAETASKTGKEVTEVLDSYVNTAAVIDGVFRDTSAKVVGGSVEVAENGLKELVKPGLLRRGFDYAFGNTKSKRQAIILGLIIKPTQEGWEELALAWAELNAKSFYTSEIQAIMDDKKNDRSALNLFDPAGFIGMLNAIYTSMSDDSTGRSLSAESWNTVWNTRWNEGFMGWMTGLLGTINPAGIYTKRKMRKAAKLRYEAAVSLNKSLKETLHMSDEEFLKTFAERYLEELNLKKLYEDWSKLKISRDVWSNELFSAIDLANEYEKNMELSIANAQKFYADTDAVKARIRSVAESLAANRKAEFADLDENLAVSAALEELLALISKAYELGISTDFIKKIELVYADVEEVAGQDEAETIKAHLLKIGLMEADDTEESTPEPAQGENLEGENKPKKKKHINTVFDNILLDSRDHKIDRVNNILREIKENIKKKAAAYENLRDKLDSDNYDFLSNESKDIIAKAIVMHDNTYDDLVKILEHDVTGEMNISLLDIINGIIGRETYRYRDGRIYKYELGEEGQNTNANGRQLSIEEFVKEIVDEVHFTSSAAKRIGEIRSLRQKVMFLEKVKSELEAKYAKENQENQGNQDEKQKEQKEQIGKIEDAISEMNEKHIELVNSFRSFFKEREFSESEYEEYHRLLKILAKDSSDSTIEEKRKRALDKYYEERDKKAEELDKEIQKKIEDVEKMNDKLKSLENTEENKSERERIESRIQKKMDEVDRLNKILDEYLSSTRYSVERDRLAKMLDLEIEDEFEDTPEGELARVKTTLEKQKVVTYIKKDKKKGIIYKRTETPDENNDQLYSEIIVNTRLQRNANEAIERFIYKAMDAYKLQKAIAGALDQGNEFESKLNKYKQRYVLLLNDLRTDEYLGWIDLENYLEVYDLLNYLDILYEHPNEKNQDDKVSLSLEEIIKIRALIIEKIERDDKQRKKEDRILDKVFELDQIIESLGDAGKYFFFKIKPVNGKSTIKYIRTETLIDRIKEELIKNQSISHTNGKLKGIAEIVSNTIEQIKLEITNGEFKEEKKEETPEDLLEKKEFYQSGVLKGRLKECETILEKIGNIATIQSYEIGKETMIKREATIRRLPNLSTNEEITESAFGKPKVDFRELKKSKKKAEGGTILTGRNNNQPEVSPQQQLLQLEEEEKKRKEAEEKKKREEKEKNEKDIANQSRETAQTEEEQKVEGSSDEVKTTDAEGKNPEETSITEEERKETVDGKERTIKIRTRTDGVVNSSRVPAYDTESLRDEKKLKENENPNAKIARILYQDFLDSGKLVELIEYKVKQITDKNKNASLTEKRQALKTVLMKISTSNQLINDELLLKGIDGGKLNSIIYIAMEIPNELEQEFSKYKNVVRKDNKSYAIIGMYQDNVNQDNVDRLNEEFRKQPEENYIKILKYNSGSKQGLIVETNIRTLYSGRIANKDANGKRKLRRINGKMVKHINIFAYTVVYNKRDKEEGYMLYGNQIDTLPIYDEEDKQQQMALQNIENFRGASGCFYALVRANDGKYYRIAIQIARFNNDFLNGNDDKGIQALDKENETIKNIDRIIGTMAKKLVDYRKEKKGSVFDVITDERTKMLSYLALIIKLNGDKFKYNRLQISENEDGNIELSFSENQNSTKVIIDDKMSEEEVAALIKDLYIAQNFRFKMSPSEVNQKAVSSEELMNSGFVYIDLEGRVTEEGRLIMFHDSSFDINEVTVDPDTKNISTKDDNENIDRLRQKGKINRMFNGENVRKDGEYVITSIGNETEIRVKLDGDEIVVEKGSGINWERVDKGSDEFNLGVNLYTYTLEVPNTENQFLLNTWYAIANKDNKVIYFIRTGTTDKDKVEIIRTEDIKNLPEKYRKDLEEKFEKISDKELEDILNNFELKKKEEQQRIALTTIDTITLKIWDNMDNLDGMHAILDNIIDCINKEDTENLLKKLKALGVNEEEGIKNMLEDSDNKEFFKRSIEGRIVYVEILNTGAIKMEKETTLVKLTTDQKDKLSKFKDDENFGKGKTIRLNRKKLSALINYIVLNNEEGISNILDNKCLSQVKP